MLDYPVVAMTETIDCQRKVILMLNIKQFRYGDNFAYLVSGEKEAMAVDGGAWQGMLSFLEVNKLTLK